MPDGRVHPRNRTVRLPGSEPLPPPTPVDIFPGLSRPEPTPASPMKVLTARAPTRIDFGGGWTDVPPYSDEEGGFVCNLAIKRYASVRVRAAGGADVGVDTRRAADSALAEAAVKRAGIAGISVEITSDFPLGAGLGGSSAAGVAVNGALAAWRGGSIDRTTLAEQSRAIEVEDLGVPGGRQDHYAAAYGGALALAFGDGTRVRRLPLPPDLKAALERRCVVIYTGQSRISGDTITAVLDAYRRRDARVLRALDRMKALARAMADDLCDRDLDSLGALVWEHWQLQRSLHPSIPTPLIDAILERARAAGARGGKALGASGGGCVLVIAGDDNVEAVTEAVTALAPHLVPVEIDEEGFACRAE
ncbi:MAG: kinase [Geminicoccaceae bacterium]|nr:kinase [Geminicoccaceae bacterium]